jgi:hypothetical protein
MLGFDAIAGLAISDDGTKHVNPFRRVENLDSTFTNEILATEAENNSVVLSENNTLVLTGNPTVTTQSSTNSATVLSDNKVK